MGKVLKTLLLFSSMGLLRDRKLGSRLYRHCLVGTEMIDWLLQQSPDVHSRAQAAAMWQVLLDDGVLLSGKTISIFIELQFPTYRLVRQMKSPSPNRSVVSHDYRTTVIHYEF